MSPSSPESQRILGIDPGLRHTGFGVIDACGPRLTYVASGCISTQEVPAGDLPARLGLIFEGVSEVVRRFSPTQACVEIVFVNVNPQSTLLLGQARGAAMVALCAAGLAISEVTALQMKKAVVGHGHATKAQIQAMVMRLLTLPSAPGPDAADALGLAIAHSHSQTTLAALQGHSQRRTHAQTRGGRIY